MEPEVSRGVNEDTGILTAVVEYDGVFKNIYDVPFVTVNRVLDEIEAEVILSTVDDDVSQDRIATAHSVARELGFRSYGRKFGDLYELSEALTIRFSDSPDKGKIWALEGETGRGWLQ